MGFDGDVLFPIQQTGNTHSFYCLIYSVVKKTAFEKAIAAATGLQRQ